MSQTKDNAQNTPAGVQRSETIIGLWQQPLTPAGDLKGVVSESNARA